MLKSLKNKLFRKPIEDKMGNGLYVTFDELMAQRQYIKYIKKYKNRISSNQVGDVKSAFKGRGIELEEVRAYSFGDDMRDIDWRVTARKSAPYTKLYSEEKDREVYVFLDLSQSMVFGTKNELKSVSAAKIAGMLGWLSLENKDRFGVVLFDGIETYVFKPQNNQSNMIAVFKKISELSEKILSYDDKETISINKSLQVLKNTLKSRAIVFIVSDFYDFSDATKKSLSALAKTASVYCIDVFDVLEAKAPKSGEYMVKEDSDSLIFDSSSQLFKKEYANYFDNKRLIIKNFCKKFGIKYIEARTDVDLYSQIKI